MNLLFLFPQLCLEKCREALRKAVESAKDKKLLFGICSLNVPKDTVKNLDFLMEEKKSPNINVCRCATWF